ncbi:F0F1 ATP synthase subunit A [Clostridia bacterium]|nr:F0F1 ATP synthase subunit A [Clostridia bacterium]
MSIDPSSIVYFEIGFVHITATLVFTWITMLVLTLFCAISTRNLRKKAELRPSQHLLEAIMEVSKSQIREIAQQDPEPFLPFVATLFLFIFSANVFSVIPGFIAPTGSLNTTIALALCVFFAVPFFGISSKGILDYLKQYAKPSPIMLPFNIISEFSRTLSLAIRLYGNVMSSTIIIAILLGVIPLIFPVVIQLLGLLTGVIQAYIFAILAIVYISSVIQHKEKKAK